ncbi:N-6 DNA methylase [Litoribaculum gwangyangense]
MGKQNLYDLLSAFREVNRFQLEENFKDIFEYLLKKIAAFQGKKSGESFQPLEITRLALTLADLPEDASIYNPFAGFASYGIHLNDHQKYYGQEINQFTWAVGQLRLKAHNLNETYTYLNDDSIDNWDSYRKYDLVVATPPFRSLISKDYYSFFTGDRISNIGNYLVDRGLNSLKPGGKLITVLPLSFLFTRSGKYYEFKKHLIKNNLIDTIISLPSGLFYNTAVAVCIVVFSPVQKRPGYVRLVEASQLYHIEGRGFKRLDIEKIENILEEDVEDDSLRYVDQNQIAKNEFDLSVERYFLKKINGVKLSGFTSIITGPIAPVGSKMFQIQVRELKDDIFNCELNLEELKPKGVERGTFKVIEESCILISVIGNDLKPTYFKYNGHSICISNAVLALRIDTSFVDPIFLINEFHADYVKDQLKAFRVGDFQSHISRRDLRNIEFKIPHLEEQRAKVSAVKDLSSKFQEIELEKQNLLRGIRKEDTESSTSLSHVLGKPLLSIGSSLEIIQSGLSNLDPKWKEYIISQKRGFTLADAFESISKNIKYIQELTDKNTALVSISNFDLTDLNLLKFLKEFVKDEKKSLNGNISLELDIHDDIKQLMDNNVLIKANYQKLKIVLANLMDNANRHAFTKKDQRNKITIEVLPFTSSREEALANNYDIDEKKSYVEVRFFNTGRAFPNDFNLDDYKRKNFSAGQSRNRGLGGYEVNEILKAHNNGRDSLNIEPQMTNSEYSSMVTFILPISQNI